ncbi:MAG: 2-dehydropantoate 2-reductase [Verrucomicrobiota bacterium]
MKIGVIGSGAIGLYYGARLHKAGGDVRFLLRSDFEAVVKRGISVKAADGDFVIEDPKVYRSAEGIGVCDLAIVAIKATANELMPDLLKPLVGEGTAILTLQNGLGNDSFLADAFPGTEIFGGLCFVCVNRVGPGTVENYLLGSMGLGRLGGVANDRLKEVERWLKEAGANPRVTDDLLEMQWRKLVWNVPFNGLAIAAGGVTTDVILDTPELLEDAKALMREIIAAAAAYGKVIEPSFVDKQLAVTRPMGAYRPSSLIDYLEGRPVEVEAIWGEPLRRGEEKGVEMKRLRRLYSEIQRRVSGDGGLGG